MARAPVSMGVCKKLDDSPVLKELYPFARMKDDMGAGVQLGMTGIAYSKKLFAEKGWAPPTMDGLCRSEVQGQSGVPVRFRAAPSVCTAFWRSTV